jgi:DTW domain-containing protein YfiP
MRNDLAGHCVRCYLRSEFCACALIPRVETDTRFVIVRHEREAYKSTNSARWAQLALAQSEVWPYSGRLTLDERVRTLEDAWLLFPAAVGEVAPKVTETHRPRVVVVLDGTWRQVRRMLNASSPLLALPRLTLPVVPTRALALRQSVHPEGRSTLEAMALAVSVLEGDERAAPLFTMHAQVIEGVLRGRGAFKES